MSATPSKPSGSKGDSDVLLRVENLKKHFPIRKGLLNRVAGHVSAVDGISFDVFRNETVGLVGESGCGKTTAGRTILRLLEPTAGKVVFEGNDVFSLNEPDMRALRRKMQIIFQDPYSSLNPRMTIESIIGEAVELHGIASGEKRRRLVEDLLERVGLQPSYVTRYPHEFSGGQRQRIGIARAIALNPSFIVCDEAVSALDVSVQAQVINLLQDLQDEYNLSFLFIAHDLSVVRHISDRVAVMYLGRIAETATCEQLYDNPLHPYTQSLLSAIPHPDPRRKKKRMILEGDVPSPINPPAGCRFHTRCPACYKPCKTVVPRSIEVEPGHFVRCHLYDPEHKPNDPSIMSRLPEAQASADESMETPVARTVESQASAAAVALGDKIAAGAVKAAKAGAEKTEARKAEAVKAKADEAEAVKAKADEAEAVEAKADDAEGVKAEAAKTEADKTEGDQTEGDQAEAGQAKTKKSEPAEDAGTSAGEKAAGEAKAEPRDEAPAELAKNNQQDRVHGGTIVAGGRPNLDGEEDGGDASGDDPAKENGSDSDAE